jgi:S1-C subfamily serine protease
VQSFFRGRTGADLGLNFDNQQAGRLAILNLDPNSLGARLGLRRGDVIMSVNGNGVQSGDDFNQYLGANPNQASTILFQRNGRQYTVQLQPQSDDQNRSYSYDARNGNSRAYLGVTFDPNYREFAVIREVKPDSPAEKIGLKPGDTLTHISGREVRSLFDAIRTLSSMPAGEEFELQYDRPQHQTAKVSLGEREEQANRNPASDDNQQTRQD